MPSLDGGVPQEIGQPGERRGEDKFKAENFAREGTDKGVGVWEVRRVWVLKAVCGRSSITRGRAPW